MLNMKKIIVHLGAHKTGSSALQNWLYTNRKILSEWVYVYNLIDDGTFLVKSACHGLVLGNVPSSKIKERSLVIKEQVECMRNPVVCLSDEGFLGLPLGWSNKEGRVVDEFYSRAGDVVREISSALTDYEVDFVFFKRRKESWLKSCWNQMKREGRYQSSFEDYCAAFERAVDWDKVIERMTNSLVGKSHSVKVYSYEHEFKKPVFDMGLIKDLHIPEKVLNKCTKELNKINVSPSEGR